MGRQRLPLPAPLVTVRKPKQRGPLLAQGLTDSQQRFCEAVADGHSLAEAYRMCYQTDNMAHGTLYNKACLLYKRGDVREMVENIRHRKREGTLHDSARALDFALTHLQREATQAEQPAARIRAIELIMKHHGLLSDVPRDITDPHAGMTADMLRQAIQERLLGALGPVIDDDTDDIETIDVTDDESYMGDEEQ
jgi:hypothetical protein